MRMCGCGCRTCKMQTPNANPNPHPNPKSDPKPNPNPNLTHNIHRYFPQYFPHFTCSTSASTRPHFTGGRHYYFTVYCDHLSLRRSMRLLYKLRGVIRQIVYLKYTCHVTFRFSLAAFSSAITKFKPKQLVISGASLRNFGIVLTSN